MSVIEARLALKRADYNDQEMLDGLRSGSEELEWEFIRALVLELEPNFVQYVVFRKGKEDDARAIFRDAVLVVRQHIRNGQYKPEIILRTYLFAIGKFLWLYRFGDELKPDFQDTSPQIDLTGDPLLDWLEHGNAGHAGDSAEELNAFRQKLKAVEIEVEEAKKPGRNRKTRMAWVGILGLLIGVAGYLVWQGLFPSGRVLYNEHFVPYRMPSGAMGHADKVDSWDKVVGLYLAGDYKTALRELDALNMEDAGYLADFYRGMCLLADPDADPLDAVPYFKQVLNQDTDYRESAQWYLAMAYLKAGDKALAKASLMELGSEGYQRKAVKELTDLI